MQKHAICAGIFLISEKLKLFFKKFEKYSAVRSVGQVDNLSGQGWRKLKVKSFSYQLSLVFHLQIHISINYWNMGSGSLRKRARNNCMCIIMKKKVYIYISSWYYATFIT